MRYVPKLGGNHDSGGNGTHPCVPKKRLLYIRPIGFIWTLVKRTWIYYQLDIGFEVYLFTRKYIRMYKTTKDYAHIYSCSLKNIIFIYIYYIYIYTHTWHNMYTKYIICALNFTDWSLKTTFCFIFLLFYNAWKTNILLC